MLSLNLRLSILLIIFFGILYLIASLFMFYGFGITGILPHLILAFVMIFIQYLIGPKLVEMLMRVKYIRRDEYPKLYEMVEELAYKAKIPTPKVGISYINVPNAFAFGKGVRDGRICVTKAILELLNEKELRAVLGHEMSHLKNRDVLFITLLSVIPLVMYNLYRYFMFFGYYGNRRRQNGNYGFIIGLVALIFYFVTNLLVLYASRIREYFADKGSIDLGNPASALATALYKLVYGAAKSKKEDILQIEGIKAFFLNDLSKARREIKELSELDLDRSGTIDFYELEA
ncbi:MAG: zinc metalloprotease HtpX, partial [Candidatus Omnitrophica bacterium]|nr:zinc metalloprotease HtpX [Candidatus Omnitrophota bacterium]